MTHWPFNFTLCCDPECPCCRQLLLPAATEFIAGTAFCTSCAQVAESWIVKQILDTQEMMAIRGFWSISQGIRFFTPARYAPRSAAAHLLPGLLRDRTEDQANENGDRLPPARRSGISDDPTAGVQGRE